MTTSRRYSLLDRALGEVDIAIRTLGTPAGLPDDTPAPGAAAPGAATHVPPDPLHTASPVELTTAERRHAAALMRVNHSGEVSAQALYRGQAFTTRDPALRDHLLSAADQERTHLAWCARRVAELDDRTSLLGPFWYAAGFGLGALAGLSGRRAGLGFVAATEQQVERHLTSHLARLPEADVRSRAIVSRMRDDERRHGDEARGTGGVELPRPARGAMRLLAGVMTTVSHRL